MIKAMIFDNDGTVYDNRGVGDVGGVLTVKRLYKELEINEPVPAAEEFMKLMGEPHKEIFMKLVKVNEFEKIYPKIYKYSLEECEKLIRARKGKIYAGVLEAVSKLRASIKVAIATNGRLGYIRPISETHELGKYFDLIMSVEQVRGDKASLIREEMKQLGVKSSETIIVGDRIADIEAARGAGCKVALVKWGYGNEKEWRFSDYVIDRPEDLVGLVK